MGDIVFMDYFFSRLSALGLISSASTWQVPVTGNDWANDDEFKVIPGR